MWIKLICDTRDLYLIDSDKKLGIIGVYINAACPNSITHTILHTLLTKSFDNFSGKKVYMKKFKVVISCLNSTLSKVYLKPHHCTKAFKTGFALVTRNYRITLFKIVCLKVQWRQGKNVATVWGVFMCVRNGPLARLINEMY